MSLITGPELHDLIDAGVIDALHENVNASSIDVRLGPGIQLESDQIHIPMPVVSLALKGVPEMRAWDLVNDGPLLLRPRQFCLAHTVEKFHLPNDISAEFKLRSSVARAGLNHALAGWCDPGFHGSQLVLELQNVLEMHVLRLDYGLRIGQMIFYRHQQVPQDQSYATRGRYNGQLGVSRKAV